MAFRIVFPLLAVVIFLSLSPDMVHGDFPLPENQLGGPGTDGVQGAVGTGGIGGAGGAPSGDYWVSQGSHGTDGGDGGNGGNGTWIIYGEVRNPGHEIIVGGFSGEAGWFCSGTERPDLR